MLKQRKDQRKLPLNYTLMEAHAIITTKEVQALKRWLVFLPIITAVFSAGIAWGIVSANASNVAKNQQKDYDHVISELQRLQKEKVDIAQFWELRDDVKYIRVRIDEHINQDANRKK